MLGLKIFLGFCGFLYSIVCFISIKAYRDELNFNKKTGYEYGSECENIYFETAFISILFEVIFLILYSIVLIN